MLLGQPAQRCNQRVTEHRHDTDSFGHSVSVGYLASQRLRKQVEVDVMGKSP
jgi:hypothetical protein